MCGLVGYMSHDGIIRHRDYVSDLFLESTIRGLHAFGVAHHTPTGIHTRKFHDKELCVDYIKRTPYTNIVTHARYSQSGDWRNHDNNHPVCVGGYYLVFNGVISMATKEEMEAEYGYILDTYNDGELFIRHMMGGGDPVEFVTRVGSFAGLWYEPSSCSIYALRNEYRPLWYLLCDDAVYYASTKDIFIRALGNYVARDACECEPGVVYDLWEQLHE